MTLAALLDQLAPDTIERACAGDRAAMGELVSIMQRPFYNLASRMLGERSLAEDAAQECLLRVVTHLSEFRGEARFSTWATRIAVNATLDFRSGMACVRTSAQPGPGTGSGRSLSESTSGPPKRSKQSACMPLLRSGSAF